MSIHLAHHQQSDWTISTWYLVLLLYQVLAAWWCDLLSQFHQPLDRASVHARRGNCVQSDGSERWQIFTQFCGINDCALFCVDALPCPFSLAWSHYCSNSRFGATSWSDLEANYLVYHFSNIALVVGIIAGYSCLVWVAFSREVWRESPTSVILSHGSRKRPVGSSVHFFIDLHSFCHCCIQSTTNVLRAWARTSTWIKKELSSLSKYLPETLENRTVKVQQYWKTSRPLRTCGCRNQLWRRI